MRCPHRFPVSLLGVLLLWVVIPAPSAQAAYRPAFQVPFACGETWQGSTRPSHSPSSRSIDWNRDAHDEGHMVVASAPGVVDSVIDLGDTSYGPVFDNPDVMKAQVLLCECTFFDHDHKSKAKAGRHLHVEQHRHEKRL